MGTQISLLGDVTIRRDHSHRDVAVAPVSSQVRLAFAMLTLERRRGVTRDSLADALWPDGLPATWESALRLVVSRVRAFIAGALDQERHLTLTAWAGTYLLRLPSDAVVDVEEADSQVVNACAAMEARHFEQAAQLASEATSRLQAPFLPERDGGWVTVQRERLDELLLTSLQYLSQAASALGNHMDAITAARAAVARAPLRESAHRYLMLAHAAAGDRSESLRVYQRLRRVLAEELGVDPDASTEALYLDILGPPLRGSSHQWNHVQGPLERNGSTGLVGWEPELALAMGAWSQALVDGLRVVVVTGEAGAHMTSFTNELTRHMTRDGALPLAARCEPQAAGLYQPIVDMLDPVVATAPHEELMALTDQERATLSAAFSSLGGHPSRQLVHKPGVLATLCSGLAKMLTRQALEHPLLLVLDDAHQADEASASLLRQLARELRHTRTLLVIVGVDETVPTTPVHETPEVLGRDGLVHWIRLGPALRPPTPGGGQVNPLGGNSTRRRGR